MTALFSTVACSQAMEALSVHRVGAEYSATLCDLGVLIDDSTESISSDDLDVGVDGVGLENWLRPLNWGYAA
jgi:hypothetical protein